MSLDQNWREFCYTDLHAEGRIETYGYLGTATSIHAVNSHFLNVIDI
jgi:hypothetical protein